jgi:hypothetical protein
MAQNNKAKSPGKGQAKTAQSSRMLRRVAAQLLILIILLGIACFGLQRLKQYVERNIAISSDPMIVVIKDRPLWMSDNVVQEIADVARPRGAHSAFDRQMLQDTRRALEANPWVARVNEVRRAYTNQPGDTLELDCDFRVPAAWVHWGQYYWLVDRDGHKLPEQYSAAKMPGEVLSPDGRINLRIIDGVRNPPSEAGRVWEGADLAAGLEMAGVLFEHPYTEEIVKIDVSNIDGRQNRDASQITLMTRFGTIILWGRPPSDPDSFLEIRPERKLEELQDVYQKFGRVDMRQPWIDVRFEGVRYPTPVQPASASLDDRR